MESKTSNPKRNDRSLESQKEKSKYVERFSSKTATVFPGSSNSNVSSLNVPENKPLQVLTHVLVTSNLDDDSMNNEHAGIESSLSHHKSIGYCSDTHGQLAPQ